MKNKEIDLIAFMGQSNMAGRGTAEDAPNVPEGTAYEFRAVTDPTRLYPLTEPFGKDENDPEGVFEPGMKTGSMVSAFVNAYFKETHTPVVGVSCAKGGSSITEWIPGTPYYQDALKRVRSGSSWLADHDISIRHRFMVWCQGCTDGDLHTDPDVYKQETASMIRQFLKDCHMETCFLIQIGNHRDDPGLYVPIQNAQMELAKEPHIILVSRQFAALAARGLMKDEFHYLQEGYNLVGAEARKNAGLYLNKLSSIIS